MPKLWLISELYYPEDTSTGYIMTRLAEGLATRGLPWEVWAIAAQPSYSMRAHTAPRRESRNGVEIYRVRSTRFDKDRPIKRLVNMATVSASVAIATLARVSRGDVLLVVTNPPVMPLLVRIIAKLRSARMILIVHDLYPDLLVASHTLQATGAVVRVWSLATARLLRSCDKVVALSTDMAELISKRSGRSVDRIVVIPNWAELDRLSPRRPDECPLTDQLGLGEKFIVQYAGNLGHPHAIEDILCAADRLRSNRQIHFLFIGSGARKAELEAGVRELGLRNFTFLGSQPRSEGPEYLPVSHVGLLLLRKGMLGVSSPSRFYNILATGRPVIAVIDPDSEVAQIIRSESLGWVVAPGETDELVDAITHASADPEACLRVGHRARMVAERRYSFEHVLESYVRLIGGLPSERLAQ